MSKTHSLSIKQIIIAGLGFLGVGSSAYFYFLQVPSAISRKAFAISALIGILAGILGAMAVKGKSWSDFRENLGRRWLPGLIALILIWGFLDVPQNYLLAPRITLTVEIQAQNQPGKKVEASLFQNGLGEVSLMSMQGKDIVTTNDQFLSLTLDENSSARFSWSGRAWKEYSFLLKTTFSDYLVNAAVEPCKTQIQTEVIARNEYQIVIPVCASRDYFGKNLLVYLATLMGGLFLLIAVPWERFTPIMEKARSWGQSISDRLALDKRTAWATRLPEWAWVGMLCTAVLVSYILSQQPGHYWSGDYAMYLQHSFNLVNHRPYAESHYIYNPQVSNLGPATYPPGYPVMIAPLLAVFGLDWWALKALNAFVFALCLAILYLVFHRKGSRGLLWFILLAVATQPIYFIAKESALSDLPFMLFFFAGLGLLEHYRISQKHSWVSAVICGLALYLPSAVRTIGIILIPAFILTYLIKQRRVSGWLLGVLAVTVGLTLAQGWLLPGVSSYFDTLVINGATLKSNIIFSITSFNQFLRVGETTFAQTGTLAILLFLLGAGWIDSLIRKTSILEFAFAGYLAGLLIWPYTNGPRFYMPLFPLAIFYIWRGLDFAASRVRKIQSARPWIIGFLIIGFCASYINFYSTRANEKIHINILEPEAVSFFEYARDTSDPEDVFAFSKPRVLGFYSERDSAAVDWAQSDPQIWDYLDSISADYLALQREDDPTALRFIQRNPEHFERVFTNKFFEIYRIR